MAGYILSKRKRASLVEVSLASAPGLNHSCDGWRCTDWRPTSCLLLCRRNPERGESQWSVNSRVFMKKDAKNKNQADQLPGPNLVQFPHVNWKKVLPDRWGNKRNNENQPLRANIAPLWAPRISWLFKQSVDGISAPSCPSGQAALPEREMKRKNNSLLFCASPLTTFHVRELFIPLRMLWDKYYY